MTKLHRPALKEDEERLRDIEYICAVRVIKGNTKGTEVLDYINKEESEPASGGGDGGDVEALVEKKMTEVVESLGGRGVLSNDRRLDELLEKVDKVMDEKDGGGGGGGGGGGDGGVGDASKRVVERIENMEEKMCRLIEAMDAKMNQLNQRLDVLSSTS